CRTRGRRRAPSAHTPFRPLGGRYRQPCPARPCSILSAQGLCERTQRARACCRSALDEAAAEHAGLARRCVIEYAGLSGRNTLLAGDELDLVMTVGATQPGRLRRAGRAHPHENLQPLVESLADGAVERTIADPVDVTEPNAIHPQRLARTDHDAARRGIELHDIERMTGGDAEPLALADGEMRDAVMGAEHVAVEID